LATRICASLSLQRSSPFKNPSLSLPLNDSTEPFSRGEAIQRRTVSRERLEEEGVSRIACSSPEMVRCELAADATGARQVVLLEASASHPERFVRTTEDRRDGWKRSGSTDGNGRRNRGGGARRV